MADFASRTASGALTAAVSAEVERLRTQHADAVREKSASDSKCRKLTDRVAALEREKADLRRQLAAERREANEAIAKEQAAQAEAKLARAEGNLAKELAEHLQERDLRRQLAAERREANEAIAKEQAAQAEAKLARAEGNLAKELAEHLQERITALESRAKGAEAAMRAEAERTRAQLMDTYRELGARTGDFEVPDREPGLRCLQWVQEELLELPAVVGGLMSYASLVTYEGAMNALSREGCRQFEVFDEADEDFERDIFKVEDPVFAVCSGCRRSCWNFQPSWGG